MSGTEILNGLGVGVDFDTGVGRDMTWKWLHGGS